MPSERPRYEFIDSLRGIAILLVIAYHSLGPSFGFYDLKWGEGLGRDFNVSVQFLMVLPAFLGWAGVAVFFAISGFCIHNSFAKERALGFSRYIVKRASRIYPPYFFALMIFYLWQGPAETKWESLLAHILLIHNFFPSYGAINPSFWSIAVEVQLYIIYMFLFIAIERYGWIVVLAICFSVEFCIRLLIELIGFDMVPAFLSVSPLTYLFSWLIGAGAAELCKTGGAAKVRVTGLLVTVSIAVAVACCFVKPLEAFCFTLFAIVTALSIIYMHQRAVAIHVPYLAIFGVISYSVYLIHQPILDEIGAFFGPRVPLFFGHRVSLFTFFVCILGVLPLYWISRLMWKHIEIPSINAGYKILSKLKDRQRQEDQMEVVSFPLFANEDLSIHNDTVTPARPKI